MKKRWLTLLCLMSLPSYAKVDFSGYASIVAGKTLDNDEAYVADAVGGGVYDDDFSLKPESLFALQARTQLAEKFDFTAQLVARGSQDYDLQVEQSYVTYQHDGNWTFYAGRRGFTLYQYSDYLEVGYAYNFIRPPITMYFSPVSHYDGISASYRNTLSDMPFNINAYYGSTEGEAIYSSQVLGAEVLLDAPELYGMSVTLYGDTWEARIGRHRSEVNLNIAGENIFPEGMYANYTTAHYNWEYNNLILNIEGSIYKDDGHFNDLNSYFVNIGYRIGDFTPTLGYSKYDESATAPETTATLRGPAVKYTVTSATLRYEFNNHTAAKFDISQYDDSAAPLYGDATLISVGIDLVF